jgi:hypothetical protein
LRPFVNIGIWDEGREKKNVVIYLDPEIVKEAKELGLNISKIAENALREAISRLKGEIGKNNPNSGDFDDGVYINLLRPGFEPGSRAREARILDRTILPEPGLILYWLVFNCFRGFHGRRRL